MKRAILDARRLSSDDLELLADYWALYKGGKAFHDRVARFIPKRPDEPDKIYDHRKETAHYLNYAGPIVNFLAALVFTETPEVTTVPVKVHDFYATFQTDCDGIGTDLADVLKERVTRAMVTRRCWLLVDFPATPKNPETGEPLAPATRAEWDEAGLGRAYLCALSDEQVIDWEVDERGELQWAIVHQVDDRRVDPLDGVRGDTVREIWTLWTRTTWRRYERTYKKGESASGEDEVALAEQGEVATPGRVPLVRIELPDELWAMNLLGDPQKEQTRARNAESWSLARTCYAMRIFKSDDPSKPPVHGPGYGMVIGLQEEVEWDAPPAEAFEPIASYAAKLKDEIYRVVHQMSHGVENNAASVGRSGQSKQADAEATVIIARALARRVRDVAKRVLELVALGRREQIVFTVGGMDGYVSVDLASLAETGATVDTLDIRSPTFKRAWQKKLASALVADLTPADRDKISKEIERNVTDEDASQPPPKPTIHTPGVDEDKDEDEPAAEDEDESAEE